MGDRALSDRFSTLFWGYDLEPHAVYVALAWVHCALLDDNDGHTIHLHCLPTVDCHAHSLN